MSATASALGVNQENAWLGLESVSGGTNPARFFYLDETVTDRRFFLTGHGKDPWEDKNSNGAGGT